MKERIDKLLLARGLAKSRHQAQALLLSGAVLVDEQLIDKPGIRIDLESTLRLKSPTPIYVSRGGQKLEHVLISQKLKVQDNVCLDIGSSTGGFTDCLLQHGASKVYALDVGHNQLDWKLRNDPRVISLEGVNARYLKFEVIGETVDLITLDVSFISLSLILPVLCSFEKSDTLIVCLVKPQFELGRKLVGKGGIVRDPKNHQLAITTISDCAQKLGYRLLEVIASPILGAEGNREFFLVLDRSSDLTE